MNTKTNPDNMIMIEKEHSDFTPYAKNDFPVFKEKDMLIVVDMQNDFINGTLGTEEAQNILPRIEKRIQDFIESHPTDFQDKLIFTLDTHNTDYLQSREGQDLPVKHCIKNTEGWQTPLAKMFENESDFYREKFGKVFIKDTFPSLNLANYLHDNFANKLDKENTIEIIGVCTDICVIANAIMVRAALPEVNIRVIADLCAGVSPESHNRALEAMKPLQIEVVK